MKLFTFFTESLPRLLENAKTSLWERKERLDAKETQSDELFCLKEDITEHFIQSLKDSGELPASGSLAEKLIKNYLLETQEGTFISELLKNWMFSFFLWSKLKQKTTEDLKKLKKQFQEDSYDELLSLKDYDIPASQPDDFNLSVKKRTKADQNSAVAQSSTMQTVEGKEHIEITPEKYHGLQAADLATLTHADLIRTLAPCFVEDQKTSGILASVSLAQFILETGWGKSKLFKETNNGFGIKASSGTKKSRTYKTNEYHKDGSKYTVQAQFRDYASFEDSLADHSAYLTSAKKNGKLRYAGLQGCTDYRRALDIIKKGGYATDPEYVSKLCNIIEKNHLTQYDSVSVDLIMATPVSKHAIPLPEKLLKKGSRGQAVKEVQTRLIACGYSCGRTGADGIFGAKTLAAVKAFQADYGLKVDGIVGPETMSALGTARQTAKPSSSQKTSTKKQKAGLQPSIPTTPNLTEWANNDSFIAPVLQSSPEHPDYYREKVIELASAQIGKPYERGAEGPDKFDCSGLWHRVFTQLGLKLPRFQASTFDQYDEAITREQLKRGDFMHWPASNPHIEMVLGEPYQKNGVRYVQTLGAAGKAGGNKVAIRERKIESKHHFGRHHYFQDLADNYVRITSFDSFA